MIFSNYGAAIISLFVKDKNGYLKDVVLGYENIDDYLNDEFYLGTVVGRYANRIAGNRVIIDGKPYSISAKAGGYHLHGGEIGFNKKFFDVFPFQNSHNSGLVFKYTSPHLEEGFPGELNLEVTYTLDEFDAWTVEYRAVCNRTTLINVTQHVYFNLSGNPAESIDEHNIKINSYYYLPVNEMQVPTGEFKNVKGTVFDFTEMKKIAHHAVSTDAQLKLSKGYDHSFVLEKNHTDKLKHAAEVLEKNTGIKMDVFTTEPAVHLYAGNFLKNITGKNNIMYNKHAGFCLETQHFPDAPNHAHFPTTILKKGETFYSKTVFKFSTEE